MPRVGHRPHRPHDISCAWLTEILRANGAVRNARVADVQVRHIGTFSSELWRLHIRYDPAEAGAPDSLILKQAKQDARVRPGTGFANELKFYRRVAPNLLQGVRVPQFHWGFVDTESGEGMILMEDVGGLDDVDWERGATADHARHVVEALARLHADWWGRAEVLTGVPSLADAQFRARIESSYARGWRASRKYFQLMCPPDFVEIGDALLGRVNETLAPMGTPVTLLHGDAHFENLALMREQNEARVLFHDWASVRLGLASFDVAVFAVQSFPTIQRRRVEVGLVATHADRVRAAAPEQASGWADPWLDYRRGVLSWMIHMIQDAMHRPGDSRWIVVERYAAAAVDLRIGDLIR